MYDQKKQKQEERKQHKTGKEVRRKTENVSRQDPKIHNNKNKVETLRININIYVFFFNYF